MTLTEQLYRALILMPCRCQQRWMDKKPEPVIVLKCGRCLACERFETEFPELAIKTHE